MENLENYFKIIILLIINVFKRLKLLLVIFESPIHLRLYCNYVYANSYVHVVCTYKITYVNECVDR